MANVAFDTLKLARRLAAAGVPAPQADATAEALGETIGEAVVSRDHLDLRLAELRNDLDMRLADLRIDLTKWMIGLLLGQTAIISALVKLL